MVLVRFCMRVGFRAESGPMFQVSICPRVQDTFAATVSMCCMYDVRTGHCLIRHDPVSLTGRSRYFRDRNRRIKKAVLPPWPESQPSDSQSPTITPDKLQESFVGCSKKRGLEGCYRTCIKSRLNSISKVACFSVCQSSSHATNKLGARFHSLIVKGQYKFKANENESIHCSDISMP
ncbi:hypothetical protein CONLIGDRAFT_298660 [Coniochaeta ligniaria NRRL 30616]|uniref:Uncharacterized protein n=1 Tax=Coniochaeta ligniaria NRRL 30616 TaxID=1408157 RepID=A0A1J7JMF0_9PEZI|nr:hypothetical protein CONLIGDRAFT_298660 [Coniochaeta ligniaria NRRL 30616]